MGSGAEAPAFLYEVSDDAVDAEMLKQQTDRQRERLKHCFLNKVSEENASPRAPNRNYVGS